VHLLSSENRHFVDKLILVIAQHNKRLQPLTSLNHYRMECKRLSWVVTGHDIWATSVSIFLVSSWVASGTALDVALHCMTLFLFL
jgi:hypothetical protein